jgi:D-galacturonate reductase
VAYAELGGEPNHRSERVREMSQLDYNDLSADRQVVAAVQAMEAILERHAAGTPNCVVEVNAERGGLVMIPPGGTPEVLYQPAV